MVFPGGRELVILHDYFRNVSKLMCRKFDVQTHSLGCFVSVISFCCISLHHLICFSL